MRVLLISHTCQSPTEGQPKVVALGKTPGVELKVVVPQRWKHYGKWRPLEILPEAAPFIQPCPVVWPWLGPAQFYMHWYPGLGKLIKQFKPDVIDLWEEPWGLVSVQTILARARYAPDAILVSETEQNLNKQLPLPFERFRSYTFKHANWLVGRSHEAIEVSRAKGYRGQATYLPNAVDAEAFVLTDRDVARRKLGCSGLVLGYVGRLVPEKGIGDILASLSELSQDTNVLIIGDGPQRSELEQQAKALGVADRVRFEGNRPLGELSTYMNAMDALVLPSHTTVSWKEQFGRVLIEAWACGTPVIGSDSGAIPHVIGEDIRLGLTFPEGDASALANVVKTLQASNPADVKIRKYRREHVIHRYTWQRVAEGYHQMYGQAILAKAASNGLEAHVSKHL